MIIEDKYKYYKDEITSFTETLTVLGYGNFVTTSGVTLTSTITLSLFEGVNAKLNTKAQQNPPVLLVGAQQKRNFSSLFAFPPESEVVYNYNTSLFKTDFGFIGIGYTPIINDDTILFTDLLSINLSYDKILEKGILFYYK